jgi:hypothetical protein
MFMRNIGNAIGAALLGGVLNSRLSAYLAGKDDAEGLTVNSVNKLLGGHTGINESVQSILSEGLASSLHAVYLVVFLFAAVSFVLLLFLKKGE